MHFSEPSLVSKGSFFPVDKLRVMLMVSPDFQLDGTFTIPNGYQIVVSIPPQETGDSDTQNLVQQVVDSTAIPFKTLVFSSLLVAMAFKLSMQNLWGGINAL